jgi:hypothetical protein
LRETKRGYFLGGEQMKRFIYFIAFIALMIALKLEEVARYDNLISRYREKETRAEIERQQQGARIEEIEKQLRLINTDIDIIQNGSRK